MIDADDTARSIEEVLEIKDNNILRHMADADRAALIGALNILQSLEGEIHKAISTEVVLQIAEENREDSQAGRDELRHANSCRYPGC